MRKILRRLDRDEKSRLDRKEKFDAKRGTVDIEVQVGDHVLVKQTKTTTKPPFDPAPYIVVEVNGTQAVLERDGKRLKRSFNKVKIIGRKIRDKKEKKLKKEEKESMEKTASGGKKREDPKRKISKVVPRKPQTDSDNDDLDLDNRWGMDDPAVLPRAEITEIVEEESAEEAFHGFEEEEVEEALELQAMIRANNAERVVEEVVEPEIEIAPNRRENLSPRERKKRKAAARAR